jgi:hypothetical protein
MSKQTSKTIEHTIVHPVAEQIGAVALTAVSLLVSFEVMLEHHPKIAGHHHKAESSASEVFARGETKGETARLPEEFDIGLQTPHVTGV